VARVFNKKVIPKLKCLYTLLGMAGTPDETGENEFIDIQGGRGGGKSETIAEVLVMLTRVINVRILCTREIQKIMKDSVYQNLVDWIDFYELRDEFVMLRDSIVNTYTGAKFIFIGMEAAAKAANIKSLKGVKIVWYEEAQTATMDSLLDLDPTIRIDGRKIIFSRNPRSTRDAVPLYLEGRDNVMRININYDENPFNPKTLLHQAEQMKRLNPTEYKHVWLGIPREDDASTVILPYEWLVQCVDLHLKDHPGKIENLSDYKKFGGFDIADGMLDVHDKNSLVVVQGPVVAHAEEWRIDHIYLSVRHVDGRHKTVGFTTMNYDATAIGLGAKSEYARINKEEHKLSYTVNGFLGGARPYGKDKVFSGEGRNKITNAAMFKNAKAQGWWNLRLRLENSMRLLRGEKIDRSDYYLSFSSQLTNRETIFTELSQATYEYDNSGRIKVDKAPGMRKVEVEGKDKDRKSPNLADSTKMAFAGDLIYGLKAHQEAPMKAKVIG